MSSRLHLSLLRLDPVASGAARRLVADVHSMHQLVMSGFPDIRSDQARQDLGVLYRVDDGGCTSDVLVQSAVEPNWASLEGERALADPARVRDASALLSIPVGARLRFRLLANPTRAIRPEGRKSRHAQRVPIRSDDGPGGRIAWLVRKAEAHGFSIDMSSVVVVPQPPQRGARPDGGRIIIEGCRFDGLLTVTDGEKFRAALCAGIGRARSYGYGLLTVARP